MKIVYKPAKALKPIAKASKKAAVVMALQKGATIEDIQKLTGWARSAAASSIATDIAKAGYGVKRDGHTYLLTLPKGVKKPLWVTK